MVHPGYPVRHNLHSYFSQFNLPRYTHMRDRDAMDIADQQEELERIAENEYEYAQFRADIDRELEIDREREEKNAK